MVESKVLVLESDVMLSSKDMWRYSVEYLMPAHQLEIAGRITTTFLSMINMSALEQRQYKNDSMESR